MDGLILWFTLLNLTLPLLIVAVNGKEFKNLKCTGHKVTDDLPFYVLQNYSKDVLPVLNTPMNISVLVNIKDIVEVNDVHATVTFSMILGITWIEPRLQLVLNSSTWIDYYGEKWAQLKPRILDNLWTPDIDIINIKSFKIGNIFQEQSALDLNDEKRFWYEFQVDITLGCPLFHFNKYPLDELVCIYTIGSFMYDVNLNRYTGNVIYNKSNQRALQYDVQQVEALTFEDSLLEYKQYYYGYGGRMDYEVDIYSNFGIKITFGRMLQPHLLCTYLPSLLLVVGSWLGFLIAPSSVPERIALSVTLLLVLMTIR